METAFSTANQRSPWGPCCAVMLDDVWNLAGRRLLYECRNETKMNETKMHEQVGENGRPRLTQ